MSDRKILVVDDEEIIRNVFDRVLSSAGFTVFQAGSGEEALEILQKKNIPVMFLDFKLPGIDGNELCEQIKTEKPAAICYAVSGFIPALKNAGNEEAYFDDYFSKPIDMQLLVKTAQDAFGKLEGMI